MSLKAGHKSKNDSHKSKNDSHKWKNDSHKLKNASHKLKNVSHVFEIDLTNRNLLENRDCLTKAA